MKPGTAAKEALTVAAALVILLGGLYLYAGHWPPAVIVESSSMMHAEGAVAYGRFGTLDPGDLVIVREVDDPADVATWAERAVRQYGDWGDVIVYYDEGDRGHTPIIHRAMAWVDVRTGPGGRTEYALDWAPGEPCPNRARVEDGGATCVFGPRGITVPEWGLHDCTKACARDGFITKGDNPGTNTQADQAAGIASGLVEPSWLAGRARGELPWIGLAKLALSPTPNEQSPPASYLRLGNAYAPMDLWVMFAVALIVVVVVPVAIEAAREWREDAPETPPPSPPQAGEREP